MSADISADIKASQKCSFLGLDLSRKVLVT